MRTHSTVLRIVVLGLLALALGGCAILDAILFELGFERAPDQVFLTARDAAVVLTPGRCTTFLNPVPPDIAISAGGPLWENEDSFSFTDQPSWLSVVTSRGAGDTQRQLCATADAPAVSNLAVSYTYIRGGLEFPPDGVTVAVTKIFSARLLVSIVAQDLAVHPTANPPGIPANGVSTLSANIAGGAPPYTIRWTPVNGLTILNAPTVVADPVETTTYTVQVTDATGVTVTGTVTLSVGPSVHIAADPLRNAGWDPGTRVHLSTRVTHGNPPFTYSWSPASGLDDPTRPDPSFTTPPEGTPLFDYTVTVTDAAGLHGSDFINVRARPPLTVNPQATPNTVTPGQSSQLMANATTNVGAHLTYQWSGAGLSATDIADPVATPLITTAYSVTVTDSLGRVQTGTVTVTVVTGPDLVVTLVDSPDPAARNVLLTYTATITNAGTQSATGVVFTETMPFMIESSGGTASQGTCSTSFNPVILVTCNLGTIAAGSSATVTLSGFTFGTGTITNTATVTLNEVDANPSNNTATATTTFTSGSTPTGPGGPS